MDVTCAAELASDLSNCSTVRLSIKVCETKTLKQQDAV